MNTRYVLLVPVLVLISSPATSQTLRERVGPQTIYLTSSARSLAMGDATVALLDDYSGYGNNPAALGFSRRNTIDYAVQRVLDGVMFQHLGGSFKVTPVEAIAANYDLLHFGGYDFYSNAATRKRGFESRAGITYGRMLGESFAAGLTLQALNSNTDIKTVWGVVGDVGFLYAPGKYIRYGLTLRGLGSDFLLGSPIIAPDVNSAKINTSLALGGLIDFPFDQARQRIVLGAQNEKIFSQSNIIYRFGLEYQAVLSPGFRTALRIGAIVWGVEFEPRAGVGFTIALFSFDYGYRYDKLAGQAVHLLTLTLGWY